MPKSHFFIIVLSLIFYYSPAFIYCQETETADSAAAIEKQSIVYDNKIYKNEIKTCLLHINGMELSNPVITLNSGDRLLLRFDQIGKELKDYYYTVILCNADWTPAQVSDFDYLDGFQEGVIRNYGFSYSTIIPYVHYSVELPNEDFSWTQSGNYLLLVYENNNRQNLVLTKRFVVVEPLVDVEGRIKRSGIVDYTQTHQELQFEVNHQNLDIRNPFEEVSVTVMQNFRWDNAFTGLKPVFVKDFKLSYISEGKILFPGMKEFRYFDIRNLRWLSDRVQRLSERGDTVFIVLDDIRSFSSYSYRKDINGKMVEGRYEALDNDLEADYSYVHFRLQTDGPFFHGNIYVLGEFTGWGISEENKMAYNFKEKIYEQNILLKQGYYNYCYVVVEKESEKKDVSIFEGDSYETENDYQVIVYYRPTGAKHDRVIAYKEMNNLK